VSSEWGLLRSFCLSLKGWYSYRNSSGRKRMSGISDFERSEKSCIFFFPQKHFVIPSE
jgi:hypothetical protein